MSEACRSNFLKTLFEVSQDTTDDDLHEIVMSMFYSVILRNGRTKKKKREQQKVKKSDQVFVSFYRRIPNGHIRWEKDMSLHLQQFLGVSNLKH